MGESTRGTGACQYCGGRTGHSAACPVLHGQGEPKYKESYPIVAAAPPHNMPRPCVQCGCWPDHSSWCPMFTGRGPTRDEFEALEKRVKSLEDRAARAIAVLEAFLARHSQ